MISETRIFCTACPLRHNPTFAPFSQKLLEFTLREKKGELRVRSKTTILQEGTPAPYLYTQLEGWGFRYKSLSNNRRQILNYMFPGDLIGLQSSMKDASEHSVDTITPSVFCVFDRASFWSIHNQESDVAYRIIWLAAREEQILEEHLLGIGKRTALERTAYLLAFLYERAVQTGLVDGAFLPPGITQQHLADTMGLSLVHTNKTLRKLKDLKIVDWGSEGCRLSDHPGLRKLANWKGLPDSKRPLI